MCDVWTPCSSSQTSEVAAVLDVAECSAVAEGEVAGELASVDVAVEDAELLTEADPKSEARRPAASSQKPGIFTVTYICACG